LCHSRLHSHLRASRPSEVWETNENEATATEEVRTRDGGQEEGEEKEERIELGGGRRRRRKKKKEASLQTRSQWLAARLLSVDPLEEEGYSNEEDEEEGVGNEERRATPMRGNVFVGGDGEVVSHPKKLRPIHPNAQIALHDIKKKKKTTD
jgi:hypothetical protein